MSDVLQLAGIVRKFEQGRRVVEVLKGLDLSIGAGEIVAMVAPSGAGKSTLLHIAGLLDTPTEGSVTIGGRTFTDESDYERTKARRELIGFVYQFHHLLKEFSALENVMMPQRIAGVRPADRRPRGAQHQLQRRG